MPDTSQTRTLRMAVDVHAVSDVPDIPPHITDEQALQQIKAAFVAQFEGELEDGQVTVEARLVRPNGDRRPYDNLDNAGLLDHYADMREALEELGTVRVGSLTADAVARIEAELQRRGVDVPRG